MKIRLFGSVSQLGLQPTYGPEDDAGGDAHDEFVEQPGDREPEPEAESPAEPKPSEDPPAEEEPPAEAPPAEEDAPAEEEEEAQPAPRKDWRDKQIIKARQAAKDADAARVAAEERAAALEALYAKPPEEREAGQAQLTREEARKEAVEQVRREEYFKSLNRDAEKLFEDGQKAFPKSWDGRIKEAGEALRDEIMARPDFIEAVVALDNAPAVYHDLAGDIDRMEALLLLPPHKMGIELAKLSVKLAAPKPKPISRTPPPIRPLDGPALDDLPLDDPRISQAEFNRRMDAAEEKRYKNGR